MVRTVDDSGGLPAPQLSALAVLVSTGPLTLGELAASEGVKPPSMTKTVQALEKARLVRRKADPTDGRISILQVTARGRRTLEAGQGRRLGELEAMMAALSDRDIATLTRASTLMRTMIDNHQAGDQ